MIQWCKVGEIMNNKCPKCGAELVLDNNKLKCDYCKSNFSLEKIKEYTCLSCGVSMVSSNDLKSCIYCNSKDIKEKEFNFKNDIEYIIPFKTTKQDAIDAFKKLCKQKWFMPKSFNVNKKCQEIKQLYIPVLLCDYDTTGVIETECEDISTWKSKGYKYTKMDKYKSTRGGNISFEKILVNISNKFKDEILDIINPYDLNELKEFDENIYSEILIEKSNKQKDDLINKVNEKTKNYFKEEMKKDIKGYEQIKETDSSINLYNLKISTVLLPVWFLNIKYKKKTYTFVMNGQTSKINNNTPIDKTRVIFLWICMFIIIFVLLLLLNVFKVKL